MKFSELALGRVFRTERYDCRLLKTRPNCAETLDQKHVHTVYFEDEDADVRIFPEQMLTP